jgi:hypothetical protein
MTSYCDHDLEGFERLESIAYDVGADAADEDALSVFTDWGLYELSRRDPDVYPDDLRERIREALDARSVVLLSEDDWSELVRAAREGWREEYNRTVDEVGDVIYQRWHRRRW